MSLKKVKLSALLIRAVIPVALFALMGCAKEEPSADYFEQCLTGEWYVKEFYALDGVTIIRNQDESVEYQRSFDSKVYSVDNPAFCNLRYIENIQKWEVRKEGSDLNLHTLSMCGYEESFLIYYTEPYYSDYRKGQNTSTEAICARVTLMSQNSVITTAGFQILTDTDEIWITSDDAEGMSYKLHLCKQGAI